MFRLSRVALAHSLRRSSTPLSAVHGPLLIRFESGRPPPSASPEARKQHADLQKDWSAPLVHYETVKKRSDSPSPDAYLIDVREPDETVQGIIPSAVTLPLSGISTSLHMHRDEFRKHHGYEKPEKDQEIIFYCRSGKRSLSACDVAKRNGYTNVKSYDGSWLDWVKQEQTPSTQN